MCRLAASAPIVHRPINVYEVEGDGSILASATAGPCNPPDPQIQLSGVCFENSEGGNKGQPLSTETGVQFLVEMTNSDFDYAVEFDATIYDENNTIVDTLVLAFDGNNDLTVFEAFDEQNTDASRSLRLELVNNLGQTIASDPIGPCGFFDFDFDAVCEQGSARVAVENVGTIDFTGTFDIVFDDQSSTTTESLSIPVGDSVQIDVGSSLGGTISQGGGDFSYTFTNCLPPIVEASCNVESDFASISILNQRAEHLTIDYSITYTTGNGGIDGNTYVMDANELYVLDMTDYAAGSITVTYDADQTITESFDCLGEPVVIFGEPFCESPTGRAVFDVTVSGGYFDGPLYWEMNSGERGSGTTNFVTDVTVELVATGSLITGPITLTVDPGGDLELSQTFEEGCTQDLDLALYSWCNGYNSVYAYVYNNTSTTTVQLSWSILWADNSTSSGDLGTIEGYESVTIRDLPGDRGTGVFSIDNTAFSVDVPDCGVPDVQIDATCDGVDGVSFTITNFATQAEHYMNWFIEDENGTQVASDTFLATDGSVTAYGAFTSLANLNRRLIVFVNIGQEQDLISLEAGPCLPDPAFDVVGVCNSATGVITFTVTNSGGPQAIDYAWQDSTGNSGATMIDAFGGSQTFNTLAPLSGEAVTFTYDVGGDFESSYTVEEGCAQDLSLTLLASCVDYGVAEVTVFNVGDTDTQALDWVATYGDFSTTGTITVLAGSSVQIVDDLPTDLGAGVLSITDTNYSVEIPACALPNVSVSGVCDGYDAAAFTIVNNGDNMLGFGTWQVVDENGTVVDSSATPNGYSLAAGTDITFSVDFPSSYVFGRRLTINVTTDYSEETLTATVDECLPPVDIDLDVVCVEDLGQIDFTITNNGGPLSAGYAFSVTNGITTLLSGVTNALAYQQSQQIVVTAPTDGSLVTLDVVGDGGESISIEGCFGPYDVLLQGFCSDDGSGIFSILNTGADMGIIGTSLQYTVTNQDNVVIDSGELVLSTGQDEYLFYDNLADELTLHTSIGDISPTIFVGNCFTPDTPEPPVTGTPVVETPVCGFTTEDENGFPVVDMDPADCEDVTSRVPWNPIAIGAATCPDYLLYHTNQTGVFDIFRLGGNERFASEDPNVSRGDDNQRVYDVAPTRSPDGEYAAFASNRDGNWEIYIASVRDDDNGERYIQRVTVNSRALDIDPVWSPGGIFDGGRFIIYESARDGNFDLFMIDVETGIETRLTNSPANDINAFWHPDGSKVLFQSDRDGLWQVYELDLTRRNSAGLPVLTQLSDGSADDHDPAYSPDGEHVLYRSYGDGNSTLYVMDVDGNNAMRISNPIADAMNGVWSSDGSVIAFQSDLDGDLDIYIYEVASGDIRLLTDNDVDDYAPTWRCEALNVIFSSDVDGNPNLFETPALPIDADAIVVETDATRLTDLDGVDYYPQNTPAEENASRQGTVPGNAVNQ